MQVLMFAAGEVKLFLAEWCMRLIVGIFLWAAKIPLQYQLQQPGTWEARPLHYLAVLRGGRVRAAGRREVPTNLV